MNPPRQAGSASAEGRLALRVVKADPIDPFETLAINMPFKSKQLLLYCKCVLVCASIHATNKASLKDYHSAEQLGIAHYQKKYDW